MQKSILLSWTQLTHSQGVLRNIPDLLLMIVSVNKQKKKKNKCDSSLLS